MSNTFRNRKSDNRSGTVNREAKSLLAKLLSTENIRVVHSATVSTATWSGETKTLTLPIWKEMTGNIYDMLVCHEVGHVLYTPSEKSKEVLAAVGRLTQGKKHLAEPAFGFLNICEDTRIERMMKIRYPGSRRSFTRGYEWLKRTGTWKLPANPNSLKFIDRVNLAYKLGPLFPVSFNTEEQVLVDRLATVHTFNDMVDVAEAMFRLAQKQKETENKQPQPEGQPGEGQPEQGDGESQQQDGPASTDIPDDPDENSPKETGSSDDDTDDGESADSTDGDGDSDGESSDGKSDRNKPENKDESSDDNADGKSSDSSDDGDDDGDESGSKSGDGDESDCDGDEAGDDSDSDGNSDDADGDAPKSASGDEGGKGDENKNNTPDMPETTSGIDSAIENLVDRNASERVYVNVPKMILKNIIEDHKDLHKSFTSEMGYGYETAIKKANKDLVKFEAEAKPAVNAMAKRFNLMRAADEHRRTTTGKTGRINPDMLHSYQLTEDIFIRSEQVADGTNHGLVMFIDWSSSMDNIMSKTLKQMMNLALFCRRVGIPFEVFGFSDSDRSNPGPKTISKQGDFQLDSLKLHNWLSGRMTAREFKRAMAHLMILVRHFTPAKSSGRYGGYRRRRRTNTNVPYRFNLGGTPLDDCIVAALDIVPAFQRDNEVQIVNTIFLTDGASSCSPIFSAGASYNDDLVVHDPVTRKDHRLADYDDNSGGRSYYGNRSATAMLLSMLRDRTESNVIGFYLISAGWGYGSGNAYTRNDIESNMRGATSADIDREWKRFEADKFAICESMGYSEYFLIPGDLEAVAAKLTSGSAEAFTKMSRSNRVNRVMLNRFVDLIAK